ncbi:MAG: hypothetical protein AAGF12_07565 [Myxococcota bacterium]
MRMREDIEAYMLRSGVSFKELDAEMWVLHEIGAAQNVVVSLAGPLVVFRMKVMELDQVDKRPELFQRLLELNANEMIHGAYGISDAAVMITCSLRRENLDFNEFQGAIDDFSMAITNHREVFESFRKGA